MDQTAILSAYDDPGLRQAFKLLDDDGYSNKQVTAALKTAPDTATSGSPQEFYAAIAALCDAGRCQKPLLDKGIPHKTPGSDTQIGRPRTARLWEFEDKADFPRARLTLIERKLRAFVVKQLKRGFPDVPLQTGRLAEIYCCHKNTIRSARQRLVEIGYFRVTAANPGEAVKVTIGWASSAELRIVGDRLAALQPKRRRKIVVRVPSVCCEGTLTTEGGQTPPQPTLPNRPGAASKEDIFGFRSFTETEDTTSKASSGVDRRARSPVATQSQRPKPNPQNRTYGAYDFKPVNRLHLGRQIEAGESPEDCAKLEDLAKQMPDLDERFAQTLLRDHRVSELLPLFRMSATDYTRKSPGATLRSLVKEKLAVAS